MSARNGIAFALVWLMLGASAAHSEEKPDKTEIAKSLVKFGLSTGALLWKSMPPREPTSDGNKYLDLAKKLKRELDQGRAASSLVQANFDVIATALNYEARANPEPISRTVSAVAAYGAKTTGEYIGKLALDQSQANFLGGLAAALKESNFTADQLNGMNADELRQAVATVQLQNKTFGEILKDEPGAMEMLQRHVADYTANANAAILLEVKELKGDVTQIGSQLNNTARQIRKLRENSEERLKTLSSEVKALQVSTVESTKAISELRKDVGASTKATQTLANISYLGWTTEQKLEAVKAGMFPDLSVKQARELRVGLEADLRREKLVHDVEVTARGLGDLASIASNLGIDTNIVTGLSIAQRGATAIAQYFSGDVLGALSTATSLVGLGKPDAAAQRHKEMMMFLDERFKEVNRRLDEVIEVQQQTLQVLGFLNTEIKGLRSDVKRVETLVLINHELLTKLVSDEWSACWSLIGSMNQALTITTPQTLIDVLQNGTAPVEIEKCYVLFIQKLRQWRNPAKWNNEIIDARQNFDLGNLEGDDRGKEYIEYIKRLTATIEPIRNVLAAHPLVRPLSPARLAARFGQPVLSAPHSEMLAEALREAGEALDGFTCHNGPELALGLGKLICAGVEPGKVAKPSPQAWMDLMNGPQLGPNVSYLIELGSMVSTFADFAIAFKDSYFWDFVSSEEISMASVMGPTEKLSNAMDERKGLRLLQELATLGDAYALQQAILYGDYTAELILDVLYDHETHALRTKPDSRKPLIGLEENARNALKVNPTLARNVVMLAMRRALQDLGYILPDGETYYALALAEYRGAAACKNGEYVTGKLRKLFPSWEFSYIAPPDEHGTKDKKGPLFECSEQVDGAQGWGAAVPFDGFYVKLPSARVLSEGTYEYPPSLRVAFAYRDTVTQAILDKGFVISKEFIDYFASDGDLAEGILNETRRERR